MQKVIVWNNVAGYMWAFIDQDGLVYDEQGERPDLETPQNEKLVDMQLRGE